MTLTKKPRRIKQPKPQCTRCANRDATIDLAVRMLQIPIKILAYEVMVREYDKKINRAIDILLIAKSKEVE